jgi:hypothetical protein
MYQKGPDNGMLLPAFVSPLRFEGRSPHSPAGQYSHISAYLMRPVHLCQDSCRQHAAILNKQFICQIMQFQKNTIEDDNLKMGKNIVAAWIIQKFPFLGTKTAFFIS